MSKRKKNDDGTYNNKIHDIMEELDHIGTLLHDVHVKLDEVFTVTANTKVPLSLKQLICETFTCKICHAAPMKPPILFSQCCKVIIGCQRCVDGYYASDRETLLTKACPHCRAERGYTQTTRLKGLDELLSGVQPLFAADSY